MIKTIDRNALRARLESAKAPIVAEALPIEYYERGHLPGAIVMPLDRLAEVAKDSLPDKDAEIVVYCASETCHNSHTAAERLEALGYKNVFVYTGGKSDWQSAGYPMAKQ